MIVREIAWRSPLAAFAPLADMRFAALLHAGEKAAAPGYSVLAAFPAQTLIAGREDADAFARLDALHRSRRRAASGSPPVFATGLLGFVGYEMGATLEPPAAGPPSPFALPDMAFGAYDASVVFDRNARRAFLCAIDAKAGDRLLSAIGESEPLRRAPRFRYAGSNFSADRYRASVADIVGAIRDGVLFQANISQRFQAVTDQPVLPFDLFLGLAQGDAPFGACLQYKEGTILSNSPERFFRIEPVTTGARIVAEPIKGTRPRSNDPDTDAALALELERDAKERAENVMIADLTRNDLSRVCRDGSIREEAICAVESHENVHHLVSRISGILRGELTAVDALRALFPCGSITGAPKIEAMKTIAEIERVGRGPYCGALGYLDDRGLADFAVTIRTIVLERENGGARAVFPAGGGVTLRSPPEAEYRETLVKAQGLARALGVELPA